MTPERQQELNAYYTALMLGGPPPNVAPPTPEEADEFSRLAQGSPGQANPTSGAPNRVTITGRGNVGAPPPFDPTMDPTAGGLSRPPAPLGVATTGGAPSTRGPVNQTAGGMTAAAAPTSARSIWSEALRQARLEAGGDPRAMRIPFEQHPRAGSGIFDRYQAVAQPGFGPPVPSRMPGQPPVPPTGPRFPSFDPARFPGGALPPALGRAEQTFNGAMDRVAAVRPPRSLLAELGSRPAVPGAPPPVRPPMPDPSAGTRFSQPYFQGAPPPSAPRMPSAPPPDRFSGNIFQSSRSMPAPPDPDFEDAFSADIFNRGTY